MTPLFLGTPELIIILVVALLLFGGARLAGLGKGVGRSIREFKEEVGQGKGDATEGTETVDAEIVTDPQPTPSAEDRLRELEAREAEIAAREAQVRARETES